MAIRSRKQRGEGKKFLWETCSILSLPIAHSHEVGHRKRLFSLFTPNPVGMVAKSYVYV